MGTYENGTTTHGLILDVCLRLFLKKGFHETSYEDICREAHVNRGSIYYHFKEKKNIRYEVLWKLVIQNRNLVLQHCPDTENDISLSIYLLWRQFFENASIRKFILDYYRDQPVYTPSSELGHFYRILYAHMHGKRWAFDNIDDLAFASFYGHLHGLAELVNADLPHYNPEAIFSHCICASTAVWNIPCDQADVFREALEREIEVLRHLPLQNAGACIRKSQK